MYPGRGLRDSKIGSCSTRGATNRSFVSSNTDRRSKLFPHDPPSPVPVRYRGREHLPSVPTSARLSAAEPITFPPLRAAHRTGMPSGSRSRKPGAAFSRSTAAHRARPGAFFSAAAAAAAFVVALQWPRVRLRSVFVLRPVMRVEERGSGPARRRVAAGVAAPPSTAVGRFPRRPPLPPSRRRCSRRRRARRRPFAGRVAAAAAMAWRAVLLLAAREGTRAVGSPAGSVRWWRGLAEVQIAAEGEGEVFGCEGEMTGGGGGGRRRKRRRLCWCASSGVRLGWPCHRRSRL